MKRVIILPSFSLLIILLVVSCKSNKSLTDRHYNNRYYIGMSKAEQTSDPLIADTKTIPDQLLSAELEEERQESEKNDDRTSVETNVPETENANFTIQPEGSEDGTNPLNIISAEHRTVKHYLLSPVKKIAAFKQKVAPVSEGDDALSLLWILILILVIVWLLGIVFDGFGIGAAIHVLAFIALILLILWLLRII